MENTATSGAYASVPQNNNTGSHIIDVANGDDNFEDVSLKSPPAGFDIMPRELEARRDSSISVDQSPINSPTAAASGLRKRNASIAVSSESLDPRIVERLKAQGPGAYYIDPSKSTDTVTTMDSGVEEIASIEKLDTSKVWDNKMADALIAEHPVPESKNSKTYNRIRYGFFSTYRRLFAIVFLINVITMCTLGGINLIHPGVLTYSGAATAVGANIVATSLVRHEHFINMLFRLVISIRLDRPLWIRKHAAKIYSYGGVHSGCGVSALLWYIAFSVLLLRNFEGPTGILNAFRITVAIMLFLFFVLIGLAYPTIRAQYHNQWEWTHRYSGYAAVCIIITQTALLIAAQAHATGTAWGIILVETPSFWFLVIIMCLLIYPWLRTKRIYPDIEKVGTHSALLKIENEFMDTCKGVRLSTNPLLENHGFASIPNPDGKPGFRVLIAKNGDWTTKLVDKPPKYLWSRGAPTMGVMGVALVLRKVVVVATGTGIGPCLSFFNSHPDWACRIVWTVRSPLASFGKETNEQVRRADPDAIVYDTQHGRPKLVELSYAAYKKFDAEAIIIISNPVLTKQVVYAMESRGVSAYGAIWDS